MAQLVVEPFNQPHRVELRCRHATVDDWKRNKGKPAIPAELFFVLKIETFRLIWRKKRNNGIYPEGLPALDLVFEPIPSPGRREIAKRPGQGPSIQNNLVANLAAIVYASHLRFRLHYDLSFERIHINPASTQDVDPVMALQKRTIGPCLQAVRLAGHQRAPQYISCEAFQLSQLYLVERLVGMKRLQRPATVTS